MVIIPPIRPMLPALDTLAYYMVLFLQPVQIHYNRSLRHSPVFEFEFLCHRIQCTLKKIFLVQNTREMVQNFRKTSITNNLPDHSSHSRYSQHCGRLHSVTSSDSPSHSSSCGQNRVRVIFPTPQETEQSL